MKNIICALLGHKNRLKLGGFLCKRCGFFQEYTNKDIKKIEKMNKKSKDKNYNFTVMPENEHLIRTKNILWGGIVVLVMAFIIFLVGCGNSPCVPTTHPSPTSKDTTDRSSGSGVLAFVVYDESTLKMLTAEVSAIADTWSGRMLCKASARNGMVGFETSNGDYSFLIQAEGYEPYEDSIYVERNKRTSISCHMRRIK